MNVDLHGSVAKLKLYDLCWFISTHVKLVCPFVCLKLKYLIIENEAKINE